MFGSIGGAELVLVLVLALLLFGPRKLPQIGRTLGSAISEFRKATLDFKTSLEREVELDEVRSASREVRSAIDDARHLRVARDPLPDAVTRREAQASPAGEAGSGGAPPDGARQAGKPEAGKPEDREPGTREPEA